MTMRRSLIGGVGALALAMAMVLCVSPAAEAGRCGGGSSFGVSVGFSGGYSSYGFNYSSRSGGCYSRPSYRSYGRSYGRSYCGPSYGYSYRCAPAYRSRTCGPVYATPQYASSTLRYVYVDPPTTVRTVSSDSAYRDWQRSAAPAYQTVPRVVREGGVEDDIVAREVVVRDVAPGVREVEPTPSAWDEGDDWDDDEPAAAPAAEPKPRVEAVNPWAMLDRGDYASARDAFATLAEARKGEARSRIGLAIAAAALNEEAMSAGAFRRALVLEPEKFGLPQGYEDLAPLLERISVTLRALGGPNATSADRWMVIAAVDSLRGSYSDARQAIKSCRSYGETHLGAKNLWRILGLSDKPLEKVVVE